MVHCVEGRRKVKQGQKGEVSTVKCTEVTGHFEYGGFRGVVRSKTGLRSRQEAELVEMVAELSTHKALQQFRKCWEVGDWR